MKTARCELRKGSESSEDRPKGGFSAPTQAPKAPPELLLGDDGDQSANVGHGTEDEAGEAQEHRIGGPLVAHDEAEAE